MQIITNNAGKELKKHGDSAFPFLVSYERLSGYETGSFLWHWHPEIELTYIHKGEMLYKVNQNTFHLKEGQVLFGNANALHAGYMYHNQDCQYIPVTFDPKLIYGFPGSILFQKYTEPILRSFSLSAVPLDLSMKWHQDAVEDIRQIIALDSQRKPMYEFEIIARLQHFWKLLCANTLSQASAPSGQDEENYRRIRRIMSYIAEHYSEKIQLEDIAELIHLSPSECSRLFKKATEPSVTKIASVFTNTAATAMLVCCSDSKYALKCSPKKMPLHMHSNSSRRFIPRSSARQLKRT